MQDIKDIYLSPQFVVILTTLLGVFIIAIILIYGFKHASKPEDISPNLRQEYRKTNFEEEDENSNNNNNNDTKKVEKKVLSPVEFRLFSILEIVEKSYNTRLYRIEIPFGQRLGLPVGRHISLRADIDGQPVVRAYTPTSKPSQHGYFDLLIKTYDFGKMSKYMSSLKPGDKVLVRGPLGNYRLSKNQHGGIGLIAGGSGLTPCLQLVRTVLENGPEWQGDRTRFVLLYQNRTPEDILMRDELDELVSHFPDRFAVHYFVSGAISHQYQSFGTHGSHASNATTTRSKSKTGHSDTGSKLVITENRGTITAEVISSLLPTNSFQQVCVCGPAGFNNAMKANLTESGFDSASIHVW